MQKILSSPISSSLLVLITSIEVAKTKTSFLKILNKYLNSGFFSYNFNKWFNLYYMISVLNNLDFFSWDLANPTLLHWSW